MSTLDGLAAALQSEVGNDNLLMGDATLDYAVDGVQPAMVVFPADEPQVAAVMRLTDEHRVAVCPRGSGSHLHLGQPPSRADVVMSLQRLHQQVAYEPADMTTTVQAGLPLVDLQATCGAQGQFLALDPPATAASTIGGIVAANMSGPRRLLYGSARDLLLGMTVIGADGKRTRAGGRVVKNVTGYDLNKLYIGSLGTLAVIVEMTFKLHPLPPGEHTVGFGFSHSTDMLQLLQTLLHLHLRLNSLELFNAPAVALLAQRTGLTLPTETYVIVARVEGPPDATRPQEERMVEALRALPLAGSLTVHTWSVEQQARLWQTVQTFPWEMSAAAPGSVVSKVSLRMSELPAFFQQMQQASTAAGTAWPIFAHAGSGIAYINIRHADGATVAPADVLRHLERLDACVDRLPGRRVVEHAPLEIKRHCNVWGTPGDDFPLMRAIKASFDPNYRLNPGRFIGGL
jgi:glycolate oxidase FAD binding subunit